MLLPVYLYGSPILRKKAEDVSPDYSGLAQLLADMWETLYHADGVGLAAPQVGKNIRLFVVDTDCLSKNYPDGKGFRQAFVNAHVVENDGEEWTYEEGCLSIPKIHENVKRPSRVRIRYCDENFAEHDEWFDGIRARVIQHEYDHLEGQMFVDKLPPIRRQLLKSKLLKVSKGEMSASYRTKRSGKDEV
ncbi:MAG: peptide deformylase [Prevotellaceae bacterium]|jgi:peptide deformylase|nr:peptide deformylase [Prevotellaceae bacterium]